MPTKTRPKRAVPEPVQSIVLIGSYIPVAVDPGDGFISLSDRVNPPLMISDEDLPTLMRWIAARHKAQRWIAARHKAQSVPTPAPEPEPEPEPSPDDDDEME